MSLAPSKSVRRRNACLAAIELLRKACPAISFNEVLAFLYLCENEGVNIRELAQLTGFNDSCASRTARRLAEKGAPFALAPYLALVELRAQPTDRRGRTLFLTPLGRQLRDEIECIILDGVPIRARA